MSALFDATFETEHVTWSSWLQNQLDGAFKELSIGVFKH